METGGRLLSRTRSVCPVCLAPVEAEYRTRDGRVYMAKRCTAHGFFETLVWEDAGHWHGWTHPLADVRTKTPATQTQKGCPNDCGLCPQHKQRTCCVLLEVTQRCNLNCPVCFASAGGAPGQDVPLATVDGWYDALMAQGGPFNIQLSGGEPTLRDDLADIIAMGREKGFSFFQLNTNGLRLAEDKAYLRGLARAGLNTVFLQFDGFADSASLALRGAVLLDKKLQTIENCVAVGLGVTLVPTLQKGVNDGEVGAILDFALRNMPGVRAVHFQPISFFGRCDGQGREERLTIPEVLRLIETQTDGRMKATDFAPGGAEHPRCSFHADFSMDGTGRLAAARKPAAACCCSSDQARTATARKWSAPLLPDELPQRLITAGIATDSFDEFILARQTRTLAVSGMAFMDAWNLDLERLQRCYINVVSPDGRLVPFCAYNLTAQNGHPLHRK